MYRNTMKTITFSYDDGVTQDQRLVDLFNKYNLKCTFNLNSALGGTCKLHKRSGTTFTHGRFDTDEYRRVYQGHEVAVHTLTHPNLTTLSKPEIIHQVEKDRCNLSELVGYDVHGMAYPCGGINNDDRTAEIIKNHTQIKYCRTITNTDSFNLQDNLFRLNPNVYHILEFERLMNMGKTFLEMTTEKPQIFYIWGHAYEMDFHPDYWIKLEEFFEMISCRDDIFYGTNSEVLL